MESGSSDWFEEHWKHLESAGVRCSRNGGRRVRHSALACHFRDQMLLLFHDLTSCALNVNISRPLLMECNEDDTYQMGPEKIQMKMCE
jgi:hypothetical protein